MTYKDQPDPSKLTAAEQAAVDRGTEWRKSGMGYNIEHSTRPSTIGHVLSSSPLALLAWIGEKFIEWSDTTPELDHILTNVSLYYFTSGFPTSIYPYRNQAKSPVAMFEYIAKPTGVSWFPYELMPAPKHVVEKHCDLVWFGQHDKGGHFAALEQPEQLWADVEEFVRVAWKV
jgi:microsomal epoxide hydrolase